MASSSPERQFRAELFRTIVSYDDETTQLREKLELAEKELEAIKRSNSVGKSSSSPQDSVIELETRLNESIEAQTRLEVILSTLQTELDEKTRQCLEYQDMLGKMSASGADEDSMTRTVRIQELQEQLDEAQGQLEEYKLAQRPETQSALAEMQSKVEAMNGQISHAKKYTAQLKAENASLAQSLVQLEGTVRNKNQEIARLQAELHASKGREEQLKVRYCIVKSQISNLRSQNNMSDRQAPHNHVGRCDMATQTSEVLPVSVKPSPPTQAQPQPRDTSPGLLTIRIPRTQPSSTQLPSTTTIHDAPHQTRAQTSHGRAHIVSPAAMPPQATAPVPQPRNPVSAQPPSGTSTLPVSTYGRFPEARSRILGRLPVVSIPECATGDILFSTTRLNYILGGGYRMDAEFTALSPIRIAHGVTGRLYLHRHLNPWLPARPGEHGYLFFGLKGSWGRDDVKYVEPVNRAVFVEENKGFWRYYGQYLVQRCTDDDLSQAEWKTLRAELENDQESFADLTLRKSLRKEDYQSMIQHHPDEYHEKRRDIRKEYDDGTRRVPCVTLRCVEYNEALFQAIHSTNILPVNAPIVKRKRKTGSHPGGPVSRRKL